MSGPVVIDVRRGHWWEAPGLGLRSARAQEATARRGDRRAPADREPRLPRRRAVLPPPPLRFYVLVLMCGVNLLVYPYWVGQTVDDIAVAVQLGLKGGRRLRTWARVAVAGFLRGPSSCSSPQPSWPLQS